MKTLNLTDLKKSDIKYKNIPFPDGQQNITIPLSDISTSFNDISEWLNCKLHGVLIKTRLNTFLDLEILCCAVASLREQDVTKIDLYVPYIIGGRSDRKFERGGNNYLKSVICPILNSLKFKSITCVDPHSDVLEACLNNFRKNSNIDLVRFALTDLINPSIGLTKNILVSPDAGAAKKIYKAAEEIGFTGEIITCSKHRDENGKLTKTSLGFISNSFCDKDLIIIDDICDGGQTFINIAKEIKSIKSMTGKIYLVITHGIFSKGFIELDKYFDGIYTTNSYKNFSNFTSIGWDKTKLKQLNIF